MRNASAALVRPYGVIRSLLISTVLLAGLSGCGDGSDVMPLEPGNLWTYEVTAGLITQMIEVSVGDPAPVGSRMGRRLVSKLGDSLVAWQGDALYARQLGGTRFDPPIPVARTSASSREIGWKGAIEIAGTRHENCRASLTATEVKIEGGQPQFQILSNLTFTVNGRNQVLDTWMARGAGIVRQEHRKNGELLLRLRYVSGP